MNMCIMDGSVVSFCQGIVTRVCTPQQLTNIPAWKHLTKETQTKTEQWLMIHSILYCSPAPFLQPTHFTFCAPSKDVIKQHESSCMPGILALMPHSVLHSLVKTFETCPVPTMHPKVIWSTSRGNKIICRGAQEWWEVHGSSACVKFAWCIHAILMKHIELWRCTTGWKNWKQQEHPSCWGRSTTQNTSISSWTTLRIMAACDFALYSVDLHPGLQNTSCQWTLRHTEKLQAIYINDSSGTLNCDTVPRALDVHLYLVWHH